MGKLIFNLFSMAVLCFSLTSMFSSGIWL